MHRRATRRLDMRAARVTRQCAEGHGRIRRSEGGRSDVANGHVETLGQHGESDDVAGLALIGTHAERRVALEVLDRLIAFGSRERHVANGDVILQIDECLGAVVRLHTPQRLDTEVVAIGARRRRHHQR